MKCSQCGRSTDSDSAYCRFCGAPLQGQNGRRRLRRLGSSRQIAGVCAGIAEYLGTDPTAVRVVWVVLSIVPGGILGGLVAYLAAWVVVPLAEPGSTATPGSRRLARSIGDRTIAGVCGGLAEHLGIDSTAVRLAWVVLSVVPGCIVLGLLAYAIAWAVVPGGRVNRAAPASSAA